ncbi:LRR receptor-like serine/threonine-protein kinase EFR [Citrus sinensis]|uniref:LRR receptor-like serine/threonine-protein kinase EFR n=1 Tax=Citrus sinensis TaxID=2711 RepID=UPI0022790B60|nr:LRR receptor-like serine/threonine-protein kinase EFR [Citrus sinensis]
MERTYGLRLIAVPLSHCLLLYLVVAAAATSNITTDQQALLALEAHISYDPTNLLAQNWTSNTSVCNWIGITCDVNSHRVTALNISSLNLQGEIPHEIGYLPSLTKLALGYNSLVGNNSLSGSLPSRIDLALPNVKALSLAYNRFSGTIQSPITNASKLTILELGGNSFSGFIPNTIGDIPATIGGLKDVQNISLPYNRLEGPIPESFGYLTSLEILDLSNNKISGFILISLEKLLYLKKLNLSFNKLEGEIPRGGPFANFTAKSFMGNEKLCGLPHLQVPQCKHQTRPKSSKKMILLVIVLPLSAALIAVVVLALKYKSTRRGKSTGLSNGGILLSQATKRRLPYQDLSRATNRFGRDNLIGIGSFGYVYKAELDDGIEVAIKVFHQECARAMKSFEVECEVMKNIRHRNLVKIISGCSNDDFKALVLEYMPNGSLDIFLYSSTCMLDIFQRLNIMIDVASALEYLNFRHTTPIIHCDLKSSNVLLDEDMIAHLSDFGIAKLLSGEDQSMTQTQTLATIGYMAPEYGIERKVSTRSDIYSYGIMLIETFTRKKPADKMFAAELSLKHWVNGLLPVSLMEVVNKTLLSPPEKDFAAKEQCVLSIFSLAMECTMELPEKRINAKVL